MTSTTPPLGLMPKKVVWQELDLASNIKTDLSSLEVETLANCRITVEVPSPLDEPIN